MALSKVKVGTACPHFASKGVLLNSYGTYEWIIKRKNLIGWTYSFDARYLSYFKRLIAGTGRGVFDKVKYASNVHQKVYIDKKEMLIGSANLVAPTIQNVSIIIHDRALINYMTILFNKHWKYL